MKKLAFPGLIALAALVTGCPHNDYTVELTPRGSGMERKLVFYRTDGTNTNGIPAYQDFPSNELAAISALYPPGHLTAEGKRHVAQGQFVGAMPADVGGAGSCKQFTNSLGSAGLYLERFRGNDDLTAQLKRRTAAADQLTELVLSWSRATLGHERHYKDLRRFLDADFRRDLKNLSLYAWAGTISSSGKPDATEEYVARFTQYLVERGYLKAEDAGQVVKAFLGDDKTSGCRLLQKFVAEKLAIPSSGPMPASLSFLANPDALERSWKDFLSGTAAYHARLRQWEKERKLNPKLPKPGPSDGVDELVSALATSGSSGEEAHLTVRLSLPAEPDHSNGKWDPARSQVTWDSGLESKESAARLPAFCYATWSVPGHDFQQQHFGRVALQGDNLLTYCAWRSGLDEAGAAEWEKMLARLEPDGDLKNQVARFQFSAAPAQDAGVAEFGKAVLTEALGKKP